MTTTTKFYSAMYGFNTNCEFVVYGLGHRDTLPPLPSACFWIVPGTWDD